MDGQDGLPRLSSVRHLGSWLQGPPSMTCSPGHQGLRPGTCMGLCEVLLGGQVSGALRLWFSLTCCAFLLLYSSASCMSIDISASASPQRLWLTVQQPL